MFLCSHTTRIDKSRFSNLGENMGIKTLFITLISFQLYAYNGLYKQDYAQYTETTQVPEFFNQKVYSDKERCKIAKWVHENNSTYVSQMYLKGYKIHPSRLQTSSNDVNSHCAPTKRKPKSPHRCGRYEDCLHEAEIYRLVIER